MSNVKNRVWEIQESVRPIKENPLCISGIQHRVLTFYNKNVEKC